MMKEGERGREKRERKRERKEEWKEKEQGEKEEGEGGIREQNLTKLKHGVNLEHNCILKRQKGRGQSEGGREKKRRKREALENIILQS